MDLIRPMLATAGELPADEDAWAYEMKWDGVRAVVYVEGDDVAVLTRNDRDVASSYPELAGLAAAVGEPVVLDGEVVALDPAGRPSFGALQQRMHVRSPGERLRREVPVSFLAFDLLRVGGEPLLGHSYDERRSALESLGLEGVGWAVPPAFTGDGAAAMAASRSQGLEGVVAKQRSSAYRPGRRSPSWVKVKLQRTQEVVVGGWSPGKGRRAGGLGALLLGVHDQEGRLVYAGNVGTGFTERALDDLVARLRPLGRTTSPFAGAVPRPQAREAHWVTPRLVGEVVFTEWTREGRLRHPAWRGLRPDKVAADVVREP